MIEAVVLEMVEGDGMRARDELAAASCTCWGCIPQRGCIWGHH